MKCPACHGQMIKLNKRNIKVASADVIKCISCGHVLQYHKVHAA